LLECIFGNYSSIYPNSNWSGLKSFNVEFRVEDRLRNGYRIAVVFGLLALVAAGYYIAVITHLDNEFCGIFA
jgi:hypothetical protein